jgi:GNAT superfamily N-acetyltransferase
VATSIELRDLTPADLGGARALLAAACAHDRAAAVAAEKLFGAAPGGHASRALAAFADGAPVGVSVASGRWVRLLAVHPKARGRGVGTALLAGAESAIAAGGAATARTADQPGNYLAPGIDERDADTIAWLGRRGYRVCGENTNLLIDVAANPRVSGARAAALTAACAANGYRIRRAGQADAAAWGAAVAAEFGDAWAFELERALAGDPPGVHLAERPGDGAPAAFAVHDGNNQGLGWFGPAGTWPAHRRRGLGEALLGACLVDVAAAGHPRCEVAWIGPRAFYERAAGVAGERRFVVLRKELAS